MKKFSILMLFVLIGGLFIAQPISAIAIEDSILVAENEPAPTGEESPVEAPVDIDVNMEQAEEAPSEDAGIAGLNNRTLLIIGVVLLVVIVLLLATRGGNNNRN